MCCVAAAAWAPSVMGDRAAVKVLELETVGLEPANDVSAVEGEIREESPGTSGCWSTAVSPGCAVALPAWGGRTGKLWAGDCTGLMPLEITIA